MARIKERANSGQARSVPIMCVYSTRWLNERVKGGNALFFVNPSLNENDSHLDKPASKVHASYTSLARFVPTVEKC